MPLFLLRFWRPLLALAVMAGCWLWFQHALSHADAKGYARAQLEAKAAAQEQSARMLELQRQAERRYVVTREAQDRFRVVTVREVHDASAPLASCVLPEPVRLRLNEAARCARDSTAPGCTPDEVPHP